MDSKVFVNECGLWQDQYTHLQNDIINGRKEMNYVISLSLFINDNKNGHGLSDNING